jgi:hypothetical protein
MTEKTPRKRGRQTVDEGLPHGRPTVYSEELGSRICDQLADGISLTEICEPDDMPVARTVRRWALDPDHPFSPQYARAREIGYHAMADQIFAHADRKLDDSEAVARDRLKVETRKWFLSKCLPKLYGDKLGLGGDGEGGSIRITLVGGDGSL